jgi:hypothetical protein
MSASQELLQIREVQRNLATALETTLTQWERGYHPRPPGYPFLEFNPPIKGQNGQKLYQARYTEAAKIVRGRLEAGGAAFALQANMPHSNPEVRFKRFLNHQGQPVDIPMCTFPIEPLIGSSGMYIEALVRSVLPEFTTAVLTFYANNRPGLPAFAAEANGAQSWIITLNHQDFYIE